MAVLVQHYGQRLHRESLSEKSNTVYTYIPQKGSPTPTATKQLRSGVREGQERTPPGGAAPRARGARTGHQDSSPRRTIAPEWPAPPPDPARQLQRPGGKRLRRVPARTVGAHGLCRRLFAWRLRASGPVTRVPLRAARAPGGPSAGGPWAAPGERQQRNCKKVPVGGEVEGMNILGLVVFAVIFGVALWKLGPERALPICFFSSFSDAPCCWSPGSCDSEQNDASQLSQVCTFLTQPQTA
ncbi:hypothetical protein R6Z07M_008971 [Ovis aries]